MDARTSKRQKKISAKQEKRMAEELGGRVMPASGAMANAKSDVRAMGVVRAEAKYTASDRFVLKKADLEKIVHEAGLERAVLQLCFVNRASRPLYEFAIFPIQPPAPSATWAEWTSVGKSMVLYRDSLAAKLLKAKSIWIAFMDMNPMEPPKWFEIRNWPDFLALMEKNNA